MSAQAYFWALQGAGEGGGGGGGEPDPKFLITSTAGGLVLDSISQSFTITEGAFPLGVGDPRIGGFHPNFTSPITLEISGSALIDSNASLYKNNVLQSCINIPATTSGSFSFAAVSFALTDECKIALNTGTC